MRRLLTTVAIVTSLLAATACSTERAGAPGAASTTAAGGSPGAPAGGRLSGSVAANAQEVCAAARKAGATAVTTFVPELAKMLEAASAGDTGAEQTARRNAEQALQRWATALRANAAKATDPQIRAVLAEIGAELDRMDVNIESVDQQKLDQLQRRLDQLCG